MRETETKLSEWHRVYRDLEDARRALAATGAHAEDEARRQLEHKVARLQAQAGVAMKAVHEALAARGKPTA